jgi:hypothetical protein
MLLFCLYDFTKERHSGQFKESMEVFKHLQNMVVNSYNNDNNISRRGTAIR